MSTKRLPAELTFYVKKKLTSRSLLAGRVCIASIRGKKKSKRKPLTGNNDWTPAERQPTPGVFGLKAVAEFNFEFRTN